MPFIAKPQRWRVGFLSHLRGNATIGMLSALLLALVLSLGHHGFYHSLAGSTVSNDDFAFLRKVTVSRQQFNITVGNAFASLVKASLAIAISIAYIQLFWRNVRRSAYPVSKIDTLFSALSNLFTLAKPNVWRRNPILLSVVSIGW